MTHTLFHSTRGGTSLLTSKQTIRRGIAPDGGLFVSDALGTRQIDSDALVEASYQQIAAHVLGVLLPDFTTDELDACIRAAYGDQWEDPAITPLQPLSDCSAGDSTHDDGGYVLELFHGPTSAFKDVALQMLPQLMARTAPDAPAGPTGPAERIMIVTATSGDTGKAALEGFAGAPSTGITVFYPEGKVSEIQRLQMVTQTGGNVAVCAVRGNFDDAQSEVKHLFGDRALTTRLKSGAHTVLSSANSINVGRLVPQVVYYFAAYARLLKRGAVRPGGEVDFCVPTGNFGDVLAGYYAKLLGLPVHKLIVASDRNNVLCDFLTTGVYDRNRPLYTTTSPSMDILVSSNLERMLYYLSGGDVTLVASLMAQLASTGRYQVPRSLLARIRTVFDCGWANEEQVRAAINECWRQHHYLLDPHTACGYHVLQVTPAEPGIPRVLLATASPYKFPGTVNRALTLSCSESAFACMDELARATGIRPPARLRSLERAAIRFTDVVDIDGMERYVERAATALAR